MLSMARTEAVPLRTMRAGMPGTGRRTQSSSTASTGPRKGINILSYVGLNPLMAYVMGLDAAKSRAANRR